MTDDFVTVVVEESQPVVSIDELTSDVVVTEAVPTVVIDPGRPGPQGPPGPAGPPGDGSDALSFLHAQNAPSTLVQIHHDLLFQPAGFLCIDLSNDIVEPSGIAFPEPGVMEVSFGFPFVGTIRVS